MRINIFDLICLIFSNCRSISSGRHYINPDESFYNYLFTLENIFFSNAHSILPRTHVGKNMYHLCRNVTGFIHLCDNFPLILKLAFLLYGACSNEYKRN